MNNKVFLLTLATPLLLMSCSNDEPNVPQGGGMTGSDTKPIEQRIYIDENGIPMAENAHFPTLKEFEEMFVGNSLQETSELESITKKGEVVYDTQNLPSSGRESYYEFRDDNTCESFYSGEKFLFPSVQERDYNYDEKTGRLEITGGNTYRIIDFSGDEIVCILDSPGSTTRGGDFTGCYLVNCRLSKSSKITTKDPMPAIEKVSYDASGIPVINDDKPLSNAEFQKLIEGGKKTWHQTYDYAVRPALVGKNGDIKYKAYFNSDIQPTLYNYAFVNSEYVTIYDLKEDKPCGTYKYTYNPETGIVDIDRKFKMRISSVFYDSNSNKLYMRCLVEAKDGGNDYIIQRMEFDSDTRSVKERLYIDSNEVPQVEHPNFPSLKEFYELFIGSTFMETSPIYSILKTGEIDWVYSESIGGRSVGNHEFKDETTVMNYLKDPAYHYPHGTTSKYSYNPQTGEIIFDGVIVYRILDYDGNSFYCIVNLPGADTDKFVNYRYVECALFDPSVNIH